MLHGIVSQDLLELYMKAYKKRLLPQKEQQRKAQLQGAAGGSFAVQIGDTMQEVRAIPSL